MKRYWAIAALLAAAIVCLAGYQLWVGKDRKPEDPLKVLWAGNYIKERQAWSENIDRLGVKEAYELFKKDGEGKPFGVQHTFAHIFGELIYDEKGVEGISDCDPTFSFGCYHSLAGKAIIEGGLSVVKDLDRACNKGFNSPNNGCLHGIGHGILGYVGYDNVNPALASCLDTWIVAPLGGCPGGVFMEHNFHTMESVESAKARSFDSTNPYAPCDAVEGQFTQQCYYYQALWWPHVLNKDYSKVEDLCSALRGLEDRRACFLGIGESVSTNSEFRPAETRAMCDAVKDPQERLWCREGAWRIYYADPRTRQIAPELCVGLSVDGGCPSAFKI